MEKQSFIRRMVFPIALVMGVMIISINTYDYSRLLENRIVVAHISAVFMFLSIWTGALFANTIAFFRGASMGERIIVSLATPCVWSAKVLSDFVGLFSWPEFFFAMLHHLILGCPVVGLLCLGLSELWCRAVYRRRSADLSIRVLAWGSCLPLILGVTLTVLMLWNGGHSYYYLYMDAYTYLFLS